MPTKKRTLSRQWSSVTAAVVLVGALGAAETATAQGLMPVPDITGVIPESVVTLSGSPGKESILTDTR
jgi:hypothetical protein